MKHFVLALAALALTSSLLGSPQQQSDLNRADAHLRAGRMDKAAKAYQAITEERPDDAFAWFRLAYCLHEIGEFEGSITASRKCAQYPDYRDTALYNIACTLTATGDLPGAKSALDEAFAAGFLDFDLLADDPDLDPLRAEYDLSVPEEHTYVEFQARNRVVLAYHVIQPTTEGESGGSGAAAKSRGNRKADALTGVVLFAPGGGGRRACDWVISELLAPEPARPGMLFLVIAGPENGWISHPAHHALEELLNKVMKEHNIADRRFHFVGVREGGAPALTYSRMSRRYCKGVTAISTFATRRWSDDDLRTLRGLDVNLMTGELDTAIAAEYRRVAATLEELGAPVNLDLRDGEGVIPVSLRGGAWLDVLAEGVTE